MFGDVMMEYLAVLVSEHASHIAFIGCSILVIMYVKPSLNRADRLFLDSWTSVSTSIHVQIRSLRVLMARYQVPVSQDTLRSTSSKLEKELLPSWTAAEPVLHVHVLWVHRLIDVHVEISEEHRDHYLHFQHCETMKY
jgi:hypothetical protein